MAAAAPDLPLFDENLGQAPTGGQLSTYKGAYPERSGTAEAALADICPAAQLHAVDLRRTCLIGDGAEPAGSNV